MQDITHNSLFHFNFLSIFHYGKQNIVSVKQKYKGGMRYYTRKDKNVYGQTAIYIVMKVVNIIIKDVIL